MGRSGFAYECKNILVPGSRTGRHVTDGKEGECIEAIGIEVGEATGYFTTPWNGGERGGQSE